MIALTTSSVTGTKHEESERDQNIRCPRFQAPLYFSLPPPFSPAIVSQFLIMPKIKATKKTPKPLKAAPKAAPAIPNAQNLRQQHENAKGSYQDSENKKKAYRTYREMMKKWVGGYYESLVEEATEARRLAEEEKVAAAAEQREVASWAFKEVVEPNPELPNSFIEGAAPPSCAPEALEMFLAFKCFTQGRKHQVADSAYSAAKEMWKRRSVHAIHF